MKKAALEALKSGVGSGQQQFYMCQECGARQSLKPRDPVKCQKCDHRVLFKMKQRISVQLVAL